MLAGSSYPSAVEAKNGLDHLNLDVQSLTGEEFTLRVEKSMFGWEVRKMVLEKLPFKRGAKLVLHQIEHQGAGVAVELKLDETLQQQGIVAERAILSCTYVPTSLQAAWRFFTGNTFETKLSSEGVTHVTLPPHCGSGCLFDLPNGLESLTFGAWFNHSLRGVDFPNSLQTVTFGENFNQGIFAFATLPSSLQSLTFGLRFNQSLEGVTLPTSLQSLTLGTDFSQSLEDATVPCGLRWLACKGAVVSCL